MFYQIEKENIVQILLDAPRFDRKGITKKTVSATLKDTGDTKNKRKRRVSGDRSFLDGVWNRSKSARYGRS